MGNFKSERTITIAQVPCIILLIVSSVIAGMAFSEYMAINRATELLRSNKSSYNSDDITYVAIGKKQIKK